MRCKSTIARFGDTIAPGDVFFANDPHNGGGLHPQDVMVQRPIFLDGELVAWVGLSAHMMDMGGMVIGSFAPQATECYQEGLRFPPVRLFRRGEEMTDVWDIFRNNIRMSELVEMDLRGLVAGCHLAQERVEAVVDSIGRDRFVESLRAIRDLTEAEMRRRISALEDGVYRVHLVDRVRRRVLRDPCALTVDGDHMIFDFEGASPQTDHYFNSKPYIIEAEFAGHAGSPHRPRPALQRGHLRPGRAALPRGHRRQRQRRRPRSPPPTCTSGLNAADVAMQAFNLALGASPDSPARRYLAGAGFESALGNNLWSWQLPDGSTDAFIVLDGNWVGGSAGRRAGRLGPRPQPGGHRRRGVLSPTSRSSSRGTRCSSSSAGPGPGVDGAGVHRAGGGTQLSFRPHGIDQINGTMFGMRRWLPLQGIAGGLTRRLQRVPGPPAPTARSTSSTPTRRHTGVRRRIVPDAPALRRRLRRRARPRSPPRWRPMWPPAASRPRTPPASTAPCCAPTDRSTSTPPRRARERSRRDRLARATPAVRPLRDRGCTRRPTSRPFPSTRAWSSRAPRAYAEESGELLAEAPHHWTDGCPVLEDRRWPDAGPDVVFRTYLDPSSGRALHVEVALAEGPRSFEVNPRRWIEAAGATEPSP